jgi:nucleoside-diphosphate-sugar epimerase
MKCFVTGATGFIGNALINRLINEGYEVRALLHKTKPKNYEKKAEYVIGDITEFDTIKCYIKDIDIVFHCAAIVKDYGPQEIFYKVNFEGTKNIAKACEKYDIKKFIFLSHMRYESEKYTGYYSKTKHLAEQYLLRKYKMSKFPVVIIRPGNVYGPGATTWVLRPIRSIQKNRISLIDHGNGIFLHTYIDNLLDALITVIGQSEISGETIDITDGDNNTTWKEYLNILAKIAGKPNIEKNMTKKTALIIGRIMIYLNKIIKINPWITPMAAHVLTNQKKVSIEKARSLLNYEPKIDFKNGIKKVENWLKNENYISK